MLAAMRDRSSRTAQHVALFRALESVRREPRLFVDAYAVQFLPVRYSLIIFLARLPVIGSAVSRYAERYLDRRWTAGPRASAVARTKLIDDLTAASVADGARQVLLLGAGYDSRAYRMPELASLPVFEVDHPATQAEKRRLLWDSNGKHVHFVPVDLLVDDLAHALHQSGLHTGQLAVVIWEGVTNYLSAEAVDNTLRYLGSALATGSRIIFTYVDLAAVDGTEQFSGYQQWHASVSDVGEQWTFGWHPAELAAYLAEREMTLMLDISAREAAARYLEPLGRHEPAAPFYRIAEAEVR
jgi:methyltransferase (TIGR00027 family)